MRLPIILSVEGEKAVHAAMKNIESDAKKVGGGLDGVGKKAQDTNRHLGKMGDDAAEAFDKGHESASRLSRSTQAATALAGSLASYGLRSVTDAAIASGDEAEASGLKLEAMLAKRGQAGKLAEVQGLANEMSRLSGIDDDKLANTAAHLLTFGLNAQQIKDIMPGLIGQSRAMDQDLTAVADGFGKAFASGNASALKRSGTTLSQADLDAIKAAKSISEAAGQLELFKRVQDSFKNFALDVGGGQSSSQLTRKYAQVQLGNMWEQIGQSAGRARAGWQGALLTPLAERIQASPGLTNAAGIGLEAGTQAAPILTFMATVGQSLPAWEKLGSAADKLKEAGPLAARGLAWSRTALQAESLAALWNGNTNIAAAAKVKLASITSSTSLGTVGAALGLLAIAAYGVNETIAGLKNVTTLSDAELDKKGWAGEMQRKWGHKLSWLYGGEAESDADKESARINALSMQRAHNRRFGQRLRTARESKAASTKAGAAIAAITAGDDGPDGMTELQRLKWAKAQRAAAKAKDRVGAGLNLEITRLAIEEGIQKKADAAARKAQAVKDRAAKAAAREETKKHKIEERAVLKAEKAQESFNKKATKERERAEKKHEGALSKYHVALLRAQGSKDPASKLAALAQEVKDTALDGIPGAGGGANPGDFYANKLIIGGKENSEKTQSALATAAAKAAVAATQPKATAAPGKYDDAWAKFYAASEKIRRENALTRSYVHYERGELDANGNARLAAGFGKGAAVIQDYKGQPQRQRDGGFKTIFEILQMPSRTDRAAKAYR